MLKAKVRFGLISKTGGGEFEPENTDHGEALAWLEKWTRRIAAEMRKRPSAASRDQRWIATKERKNRKEITT
jgi:hypothetical protein